MILYRKNYSKSGISLDLKLINIMKYKHTIKKNIRKFIDYFVLNKNAILNKTYIPNRYEHLYIEVTNKCNLGCKFCAYTKGSLPKKNMTNDFFKEVIEKACEYGYSKFGLTPDAGEVFLDKYFIEKLDYLEQFEKVKSYSFFSNMTLMKREYIDFLVNCKKLTILSISIYGHDEESFIAVTGSDKKNYFNLLKNLQYLLKHQASSNMKIEIGFRTIRDFSFEKCNSELCLIIKKYKQSGTPIFVSTQYNNWGGLIKQNDVKDLDILLSNEDEVYKKGACSLIFYKNIVLSDGRINACASRDINKTMIIGDLTKQNFNDIFNYKNKKYINLIKSQNKGDFHSICKNCDFYRSIYKKHDIYRYHVMPPTTLKRTFKAMSKLD